MTWRLRRLLIILLKRYSEIRLNYQYMKFKLLSIISLLSITTFFSPCMFTSSSVDIVAVRCLFSQLVVMVWNAQRAASSAFSILGARCRLKFEGWCGMFNFLLRY